MFGVMTAGWAVGMVSSRVSGCEAASDGADVRRRSVTRGAKNAVRAMRRMPVNTMAARRFIIEC